MRRIDLYFLLLASVLLICGVTLGIVMGMRQDFQLTPVHAHINLVGWTSLALFGLVYRAYPQLAQRKLARFHLILSGSGAVLFPAGVFVAVTRNAPGLAIFGAILWLSGAVIFLLQLLRLFGEKSEAPALAPAE
jgi:hypothetical protein